MNYRGWLVVVAGLLLWSGPSAAQVVVVSNSVQEHRAVAGESHSGVIRLRNNGGEAKEVRVYQTDYLFYADGRSEYADPGSHARSNARWLRVRPVSLVVAAGDQAEVHYTATVPVAGREPVTGTYWSMIMVEPVEPVEAGPQQSGIGVRTVVRFGIQIATHVGAGSAVHRVQLGTPQVVVAADGTRALELELGNNGEMGYRPKVTLELYDAGGGLVARIEEQRGLLYPGTGTLQRFPLGDLGQGNYEALLVVDTGAPDMFGGQFRLTIGRNG